MRYHVYADARYIDGEAAAGQTLTVYEDEAMLTAATLYVAEAGATEVDNPFTVPGTGIVDFWVEVAEPYVLAQDDTTARPLPVMVAPGFSDDVTIEAHRLLITGGGMTPGEGHWGHIEIDHEAPETVSAVGFLNDGTPVCQVGIDEYAHFIGMYTGTGTTDRFAIGNTDPYRIQIGGVTTPSINTSGWPFFRLAPDNATSEPVLQLLYPDGQAASIIYVQNDTTDEVVLELDENIDLRFHGNLLPIHNNASQLGDIGHALTKLYLHDGASPWGVTIDAAGTFTATKVPENYLYAPSFELDRVTPGTAEGWIAFPTTATEPTRTLVTGRTKGYAQRIQHTGEAADSQEGIVLGQYPNHTALGSFTAGDSVTVSVYAKVAGTGTTSTLLVGYYDADLAEIGAADSATLTNTGTWARYSVTGTAPADTSCVRAYFWVTGISENDITDLTVDDCLLEKAASASVYFDGSYTDCVWEGVANLSPSYKG